MLAEPKLKILLDLVRSASQQEVAWMSGYLSGLLAASTPELVVQPQHEVATPAAIAKPAVQKITIAYGTETGNSKKLASAFATRAKKEGINAKVVSLDQYRLTDLAKEEYFLTIISTQGEGEPPATAKKFYDHIHLNGFKLPALKYSVLALGDTSYPLFCKAGEDVDFQFSKLGGQRLLPLQKCDTDYEADADSWFAQVLAALSSPSTAPAVSVPVGIKKTGSGKKIYNGIIVTNVNLNDRGSDKQTHHIEIIAEDLEYQPGDSIGIVPENPLQVVEAIIQLTGISSDKKLSFRNEQYTVKNLLQKKLNIAYLPERVVKQYAEVVRQEIPETKIALADLLRIYPVKDAQQFEEIISILEPIVPRLYSISSSPEAHSGEVHVTVARDNFKINGEVKYGLCSDYLVQLSVEQPLSFYIHKNSQFRLPDADKDVIMIGPGTGIAPFRSFIAHRDAVGGDGRNWLFFGDQHFTTDFLYQTELQNWLQTGVLSRINVAFSRDQSYKLYVQHRMLEQAPELWKWLQSGAYVYVCGAKEPMSKDVEYTLLQIIERFGSKTAQEAIEYFNSLKEEGRYLTDVY
ncbi:MAG: flavodoxin domain-containing protein [Chitinophagaceae bacterium]